MFKLKLLVVLYNKLPLESETIQSLISAKNEISEFAELIIWDNSSRKLQNSELSVLESELTGIEYKYYADGKNTYLSVIYNRIIKEINNEDYLVILDHDSTFDKSFLFELVSAIKSNPQINLFLPIILSNNEIVSPANIFYFYGSHWKTIKQGVIKSKGVTAINSGMTISGSYLKNKFTGYNEKIKFYGTDIDFMYKYELNNEFLYVLNTKIVHILNYQQESDLEDKIKRFSDVKYGFFMNTKEQNILIYFLSKAYFLLYSLKLCFAHNSTKFLLKSK